MPRVYCQVRLEPSQADSLKERHHGNLSAGIRAAVAAYLDSPADDPGKPEIPSAAPVKARKAKPVPAVQGPQLHQGNAAPKAYKHRERWCRPCLAAGEPRCAACRHVEGQ